jgi:hypothetical protein
LLRTAENKNVNDWSPDGELIVYNQREPDHQCRHLDGVADRGQAASSIPANACQRNSGTRVARRPLDRVRVGRIRDMGGSMCRRSPSPARSAASRLAAVRSRNGVRDGRELLYLSADHRLMSVDVQLDDHVSGRADHGRCSASPLPADSTPTAASTSRRRTPNSFSSTRSAPTIDRVRDYAAVELDVVHRPQVGRRRRSSAHVDREVAVRESAPVKNQTAR